MTVEPTPRERKREENSLSRNLGPITDTYQWFFSHLLPGLIITGAAAAVLFVGLLRLVDQVLRVSQGQTDFCQDYIAAQRILQGVAVYQPLHCWASYFLIPTALEYDTHAPFSGVFFLPFGFLPQVAAYTLWGFCCLAAYLASGFLLLRALGWRSFRAFALFVVLSTYWSPLLGAETFQNLLQINTLLLVAAWYLQRKGHERWAGGFLGLAALLKIWPVVLVFYLLTRRRWRLVIASGLTMLLGGLLSLLVLGPGAYLTYLGPVRLNEINWISRNANISLVGVVTRTLNGYHTPPILFPPVLLGLTLDRAVLLGEIVAGSVLAGTLVFLWWSTRQAKSAAAELVRYGLLITVVLLIFPLTWYYELITLLLAFATTLLALRQMPRLSRWWWLLLVVSLLPLTEDLSQVLALAEWMQRQSAMLARFATLPLAFPTFGLVLFAGLQAYLLWRLRESVPVPMDQITLPVPQQVDSSVAGLAHS